jgi:thiol-disulfide isomerase/thioredoxin
MKKLLLFALFCFGVAQSMAQLTSPPPPPEPRHQGAPPPAGPPPPPGAPMPADEDTGIAPYLKYTSMPAFNMLLLDSVTQFNTYSIKPGSYTAFVFFDPGCSHCQKMTQMLIDGMDSLKNINFYFVTFVHDMHALKDFYQKYHLAKYKNIKQIGRDEEFFFQSFYKVKFVPDIMMYDKQKKLVKMFEKEITIQELYDAAHGKKME